MAFACEVGLEPEVREKFDGFTLLQVTDAILLCSLPSRQGNIESSELRDTFSPRLLAETWFLLPRLTPGKQVTSPLFGYSSNLHYNSNFRGHVVGLHRFTRPRDLVDEIARLRCCVRWKSGRIPQRPFEVVDLGSFDPVLSSLPPPIADEQVELLVNHVPTCEFCYECVDPRVEGSMLCRRHVERIRALAQDRRLTTASLEVPCTTIEWMLPSRPESAVALCREILLLLRKHPREHIWTIDCEGLPHLRRGLASVPCQISVVNFANSLVKHAAFVKSPSHSHVRTMTTEIRDKKAIEFKSLVFPFGLVQAWLKPSYTGWEVKGIIVAEHNRRLRDIGFDESKALVFNWGSTKLDADGLGRILRQEDTLVVDRSRTTPGCRVINLLHAFWLCADLQRSMSLKAVWKTFFPNASDVELTWHDAEWDARATAMLLDKCVEE